MRVPPNPSPRRRLHQRAIPLTLATLAATALGDAADPRPVSEASADDAAAEHVQYVRDAPRPAAKPTIDRASRRERIVRTAGARQAFQRAHPQGGIDVHGRFSGIVDVDTFISAYGGAEALVSHIAASARPHTGPAGYQLEPVSEGAPITARSPTGDCFIRAYAAHSALLEAAAGGDGSRVPSDLKREALVPCLTATSETDVESAYHVREALIQRWPTVSPADYETERELKEARYVEYCKSAVRELSADGVSYSEQAVPVSTLENDLKRNLFAPSKCGGDGVSPAPVVRWLASIGAAYFGGYDAKVEANPPPRPHDWDATLTGLRSLLTRDDVGGVEIAGPERYRFDAGGKERFKATYNMIAEVAMMKGKRLVLRADVGQGAVDPAPGRPYQRDAELQLTADGVPLHHDRARHNLDAVLGALEELRADGRIRKGHVVVRFGNATHATPDHARRMRELGVIAEVALGADLSSGAIEQSADPFANHSFLTMVYYQAPLLVASGGDAAVGTSVRAEYRRTFDMVEQFLSGLRKVRVKYDAATMADRVAAPGRDGMVWLSADQLTNEELDRFINAYACLVDGADQYRTWMATAAGAVGAPTASRVRAECPRMRL